MFTLQRNVYLDHNATTVVTRKVARKMARVLRRHYGNPSSLYRIARDSASILEGAREAVARTINAKPEEITFTGSATEANNQVLKVLGEIHHPSKNKIISTPIEHPSVMETLSHLETRNTKVEYLPVDAGGRVTVEALEEMIGQDTYLVCCMLANNEIGTIQDVAGMAEIAHRRGALLFSDCVQALGKLPVDVEELGVDYATFSAHKIHGPKGVGALYVRSGAPVQPFIHGGHQEAGMRAGTEAVHSIAGMAEACRAVPELLSKMEATAARKAAFARELAEIAPGLCINSPDEGCLPNTLSATFPGVNNAVLMAALDLYGVAVSAGSACSTSETTPSHVLKAIGLSDEQADRTIRFSLSGGTSPKELRYALGIIRNHLEGKTPSIRILKPSQLDERLLFDEDSYILDIRFWHERKILKGLPNSFEASFVSFKKYLHHVPRDKQVIVVCMGGVDAVPIAYSLKSKGYDRVSFLLGGVTGWRFAQPRLYARYAGTNITRLEPRGRS
jgi:cysteine desulfurase